MEKEDGISKLTAENFINPPGRMMSYEWGDPLTRENFMSMILQSHWHSEGSLTAQLIGFEWGKVNLGIDYRTAFKACLESNGWECLSNHERAEFISAFNSIPAHRFKGLYAHQMDGDLFDNNLKRVLDFNQKYIDAIASEVAGLTLEEMREKQENALAKFNSFQSWRDEML